MAGGIETMVQGGGRLSRPSSRASRTLTPKPTSTRTTAISRPICPSIKANQPVRWSGAGGVTPLSSRPVALAIVLGHDAGGHPGRIDPDLVQVLRLLADELKDLTGRPQ